MRGFSMDTNSLFGDFNRQALILAHTALKSDDPRPDGGSGFKRLGGERPRSDQ